MGEHALGNAGPGGDFTGERKELSRHGGSRVTDPVRCRLLRLIYSCLPSYKTYIQRGKCKGRRRAGREGHFRVGTGPATAVPAAPRLPRRLRSEGCEERSTYPGTAFKQCGASVPS